MQSLNNQSNISLRPNGIYIGSWDDILQYQNIQINLKASTNCQITYYESNDKVLINATTYSYVGNNIYFNSINSTSRYVYFTVRNTTNVQQTNFNFSVLYKQSPTTNSVVGSDVNIVSPVDGSGYVEVVDMNNNYDVSGNLKVAVQNNPAGSSVQLADGFVSTHTDSYQIKYLYKNLTVYGSTDTNMVLRLELSDDNTTYYPTQYAYTVNSGQNLGFNIPAGSYNWVRFAVNNAVNNLILYLNYS
jgi:hypothetical protein